MHLLHRDDFGSFLNEAGLTGAGVEVGSAAGQFAAKVLRQWQGEGDAPGPGRFPRAAVARL